MKNVYAIILQKTFFIFLRCKLFLVITFVEVSLARNTEGLASRPHSVIFRLEPKTRLNNFDGS